MHISIQFGVKVARKTMADGCLGVSLKLQMTLAVVVYVLAAVWMTESEDSLRGSQWSEAVKLGHKWCLKLLGVIICLQPSQPCRPMQNVTPALCLFMYKAVLTVLNATKVCSDGRPSYTKVVS